MADTDAVPPFAALDLTKAKVTKMKPNPKDGKTAFINVDGHKGKLLYRLPTGARIKWAVRPGMNDNGTVNLGSFKMTVELDVEKEEHAAFVDSGEAYNTWLKEQALESCRDADPKAAWIVDMRGKVVKELSKPNGMPTAMGIVSGLCKSMVRDGDDKEGGGKYNPTMDMRVVGWADYADDFIIEQKGDKKYVKEVLWREMYTKDPETGEPVAFPPNATQFNMYVDVTDKDGNKTERLLNRLPCTDKDGKVRYGADGQPMVRYVGPQDVQVNGVADGSFRLCKVWASLSFGTTVDADVLELKPPQKWATESRKAVGATELTAEDIAAVEAYSIAAAQRAAAAAAAAEAAAESGSGGGGGADGDKGGDKDDAVRAAASAASASASAAGSSESSRKRRRDDDDSSVAGGSGSGAHREHKRTKPSRVAAVDEEL